MSNLLTLVLFLAVCVSILISSLLLTPLPSPSLSLFLPFLLSPPSSLLSPSLLSSSPSQALHYLVLISEVDEKEIFKICLEYWNHLTSELYHENPFSANQSPLMLSTNNIPPRRQLYLPVLSKVGHLSPSPSLHLLLSVSLSLFFSLSSSNSSFSLSHSPLSLSLSPSP